jgi:hypothetical protein
LISLAVARPNLPQKLLAGSYPFPPVLSLLDHMKILEAVKMSG